MNRQSRQPVRTPDRFLVFGSPAIEEPEIEEVERCLRSCWLGTGPRVAEFEEAFQAYQGFSHAVAVNSCTAALHLSMIAADLKPGDEVITTALTFAATVNSIIHAGLTPVLADIDPVTQNIDPEDVKRKITPRTRAILPVHFAGRPCEMDEITAIVRDNNLKLIEDCAHAIESRYNDKPCGSFGDFGCFSFYVTKNIVTGEGGMVVTKRDEDAGRIKTLALHGMTRDAWKRFGDEGYRHYQVVECGFKYNMMDLQAAIGIHQLARIDAYLQSRRDVWEFYNQQLKHLPLILPADPAPNTRHAYHLYTIRVDSSKTDITRDQILDRMTREGIGVGVHYLSIPEHPFYQKQFGWNPDDYPNARDAGRSTISIPISAKLTSEDLADVVEGLNRSFEG